MTSFNEYLAQGNAWLFVPAAILLGALHGLEPGHSKTMMAAFIVAIRGSVLQAVLLGLSATVSHTVLIWVLAFVGLKYSAGLPPKMWNRICRSRPGSSSLHWLCGWSCAFGRCNGRRRMGRTGAPCSGPRTAWWRCSVYETDVRPGSELHFFDEGRMAVAPPPDLEVTCETLRTVVGGNPDRQVFGFKAEGAYLEATDELPEPHEFELRLTLSRAGASRTLTARFAEDHGHAHRHGRPHPDGHGDGHGHAHEFQDQDEHERAHARDWQQRFANRNVTTGQLIMFGLTGGLLPCPSAFAVLLICLQIKRFVLGFALVLAFSLGLAITLVAVGSLAALSVKHATKRFAGLHKLAAKMPYASAALMTIRRRIGLHSGVEALAALTTGNACGCDLINPAPAPYERDTKTRNPLRFLSQQRIGPRLQAGLGGMITAVGVPRLRRRDFWLSQPDESHVWMAALRFPRQPVDHLHLFLAPRSPGTGFWRRAPSRSSPAFARRGSRSPAQNAAGNRGTQVAR